MYPALAYSDDNAAKGDKDTHAFSKAGQWKMLEESSFDSQQALGPLDHFFKHMWMNQFELSQRAIPAPSLWKGGVWTVSITSWLETTYGNESASSLDHGMGWSPSNTRAILQEVSGKPLKTGEPELTKDFLIAEKMKLKEPPQVMWITFRMEGLRWRRGYMCEAELTVSSEVASSVRTFKQSTSSSVFMSRESARTGGKLPCGFWQIIPSNTHNTFTHTLPLLCFIHPTSFASFFPSLPSSVLPSFPAPHHSWF